VEEEHLQVADAVLDGRGGDEVGVGRDEVGRAREGPVGAVAPIAHVAPSEDGVQVRLARVRQRPALGEAVEGDRRRGEREAGDQRADRR
jgi:hypothetical protein